jgi:hypothetical protein
MDLKYYFKIFLQSENDIPVFRHSGVPAFRCSGIPAFRCSFFYYMPRESNKITLFGFRCLHLIQQHSL